MVMSLIAMSSMDISSMDMSSMEQYQAAWSSIKQYQAAAAEEEWSNRRLGRRVTTQAGK